MPTRIATVLTAALLPLLAAQSPAAEPTPPKQLVTKVFSVADLVTPVPEVAVGTSPDSPPAESWKKPTTEESAEELIRQVTEMVRPYSWNRMGGPGKAEFYEIGGALVVQNTPDVVAEVADLLEALRRLQAVSVCTEVRLLKVPAGFREAMGLKEGFLTAERLAAVLALAQRDAAVLQFPKVTTFNGQVATVRCGERRTFVTGVEATRTNGQAVLVPKHTTIDLGETLTLCGRVSADGQFVNLRVKLTQGRINGQVEHLPVTTMITPVFQGGGRGAPLPFTQHLQIPNLKTEAVEKKVVVRSGATVVLGGWKEEDERFGPPFLSKIPYQNRLFKNVSAESEHEVVVLATTHVIRPEPAAVAPMPRAVPADAGWPERYNLAGLQDVIAPFASQWRNLPPEIVLSGEPRPVAFQLRNTAAADTARAVTQFLKANQLDARVTYAADRNLVFLQAQPPVCERVSRLVAAIDAPPRQCHLQAMVMQVPVGFLADIGLTDDTPGSGVLTLTEREVGVLHAAVRREKQDLGIAILSRPQLLLVENQTGYLQVGGKQPVLTGLEITAGRNGPVVTPKAGELDFGLRMRVTPRITPAGEISLRVEGTYSPGYTGNFTPVTLPPAATGLREPVTFHLAGGDVAVYGVEATAQVADGRTVVVRGLRSDAGGTDGPFTALAKRCVGCGEEIVVVLTPHVVRAEPVQPAGHTTPAPNR